MKELGLAFYLLSIPPLIKHTASMFSGPKLDLRETDLFRLCDDVDVQPIHCVLVCEEEM
ncbi:unnamed protein product [Arabidopsis halleri]